MCPLPQAFPPLRGLRMPEATGSCGLAHASLTPMAALSHAIGPVFSLIHTHIFIPEAEQTVSSLFSPLSPTPLLSPRYSCPFSPRRAPVTRISECLLTTVPARLGATPTLPAWPWVARLSPSISIFQCKGGISYSFEHHQGRPCAKRFTGTDAVSSRQPCDVGVLGSPSGRSGNLGLGEINWQTAEPRPPPRASKLPPLPRGRFINRPLCRLSKVHGWTQPCTQ